jgi:ABC-type uncharacterized transport system permease subunit
MASNTPTLVDSSAEQHELGSLHPQSPKLEAVEKEEQEQQEQQVTEETPDEAGLYPGGIELTLITIGLCLAVFLVALVSCLFQKTLITLNR